MHYASAFTIGLTLACRNSISKQIDWSVISLCRCKSMLSRLSIRAARLQLQQRTFYSATWLGQPAASTTKSIPKSKSKSAPSAAEQAGNTRMKRSAPSTGSKAAPKSKKPRVEVPEYHLTPSVRDGDGEIIWPAPNHQIETARKMILEWYVQVILEFHLHRLNQMIQCWCWEKNTHCS